eukprot:TRINITY_DN1099_c0_g1_i2.p1 TRINITY_DN1099_c0_g1~~TRINITY_DN1099_c0_g1_i2.p1  ORF type:complete len:293 (-),score=18.34 TRINITY_DN1099_c0_g1_i2:887-1765(-)
MEMGRWEEEYGRKSEISGEQAWRHWLESHDKIAKEAVGYTAMKKFQGNKVDWDPRVHQAVREKNKIRKQMGRVRDGDQRKQLVEDYRYWRNIVKRILNKKRKRKQQVVNEKLEKFRGKDEKKFWRYLKSLAGLERKDDPLPEEVQLGDRVEKGEKRKEVWNEAFSRLGKFDIDDKDFDKDFYWKVKKMEGKWLNESSDSKIDELDRDIEMKEVIKALNKAKNGKSAGVDGCINEILKLAGEAMQSSLLVLFQKIWSEEAVPQWTGLAVLLFHCLKKVKEKMWTITEALHYLV